MWIKKIFYIFVFSFFSLQVLATTTDSTIMYKMSEEQYRNLNNAILTIKTERDAIYESNKSLILQLKNSQGNSQELQLLLAQSELKLADYEQKLQTYELKIKDLQQEQLILVSKLQTANEEQKKSIEDSIVNQQQLLQLRQSWDRYKKETEQQLIQKEIDKFVWAGAGIGAGILIGILLQK